MSKEKNTGRNFEWETRMNNWRSTATVNMALDKINNLLGADETNPIFTYDYDGNARMYQLYVEGEKDPINEFKGNRYFLEALNTLIVSLVFLQENGSITVNKRR